jgi:hypothetical protein
MMKCGQPTCACHRDASQRHGPYFEWTYKVKGKTVNVKLSPQPHRSIRPPPNSTVNSRPPYQRWNACHEPR